ncbi:hypothetical protein GUITHDRAFT_106725 [Guillardia theta CCMP2712]|uniref:PDZ domain-containing protein n=1 Tax=Guillardia theta (strain CCMP2712) TaxID=905079 RepID=L1JGS9_GUITC|nr:hypothetical protein GUITHDRAFT_106725 [Guillardia theta CCMP2712]EKX47275.1 hypothetical protein GUITHDRAFT_106725 [Guillardia theta CCMP2712]|eukprot:XP_005834255.1 hypothetical protein GUITHDRAFT_106725 [Guillardia theta CCMP2712]
MDIMDWIASLTNCCGGPKAGSHENEAGGHLISGPKPGAKIGVGIIFLAREKSQQLIVAGVAPSSPAELCNEIVIGEELVSVDGADVKCMSPLTLRDYMLGPVGSKVQLGFRRPDGDAHERVRYVTLQRSWNNHLGQKVLISEIDAISSPST